MTLKAICLVGAAAALIGCGPVDAYTYTMTPDGKLSVVSNVDANVEENMSNGVQSATPDGDDSGGYSAMACSRTYCFYFSSCGCSSDCTSEQCWQVCRSCFGY